MNNATYIKGSKLEWPNLWNDLGMAKDNGGRWYPGEDTPEWVTDYLYSNYRAPSRSYPFSFAKALLTQKFAKHLCEKDSDLAKKVGVAE